jgi:syntaxin 16
MRDWLHRKSAIEHSIRDISNAIERLCSEHERYSLVERQLGSENDMAEYLFTQIVGMFISTQQKIDDLILGDLGTELHALCRNARLALMAKLGRCAESLRKAQLAQADAISAMELRLKSPIIKARHFSAIEDPTQTQQLLDLRLSTLTDRNKELTSVNESLGHVCGLLRSMQTMVIEQGSVLDHIDYNLERAQRYVVKGNVQLAKAQKRNITQQSKVMFLLFLALLAFLLVLGIVVRASGHRNQ